MPLKRKAVSATTDEPLSKRCTRSSGTLVEEKQAGPAYSGRTRLTVATPVRANRQPLDASPSTISWSTVEGIVESLQNENSEDELNLTPRPSRLGMHSRTTTPRMILHSVEIRVPSHISSLSPHIDRGSPIPPHRRCALGGTGDGLVTHTPPSSPLKNHYVPYGSRTNRNIASNTLQCVSPSKIDLSPTATASPSRLPRTLPNHLHSCLHSQKQAVLYALQHPQHIDLYSEQDGARGGDEMCTNDIALQQLSALLSGTVSRGEGNSCILLGPRGSGKTQLVERCLANLPDKPIILRLSGWAQHNDRLAMREIAWQLMQQTGTSFLESERDDSDADEDINPFIDVDPAISLPPSSHLPTLISVIPTLARPTIIVLDAFDLFALHTRQSLLYCLLDTAQSCRVGEGRKGIAVIGVTSRVDTINLLEKRVKSRFSGRMLRTAPPSKLNDWIDITKRVLRTPIVDCPPEWSHMWNDAVDKFLAGITDTLNDTFSVTRDVRMLSRILTGPILELVPSSPFPTASQFKSAVAVQRCRPRFHTLHSLPYPSICLLIAAMHSQRAGHDVVTFEMLYECFRDQVRASTSAPVQIGGGGIGMVRCTRQVLMGAFEQLGLSRAFVTVTTSSTSVANEFVRYRCTVDREDVKNAVEKNGQTSLKKWLNKAQ